MGWLDTLFGPIPDVPQYQRHDSIGDVIAADVASRTQSFSMDDALGMPSVRRGIDLIVSVGASLQPQTYRDGKLIDNPRIVERPDPTRSRYDWQLIVLRSLIEYGNTWLKRQEQMAVVVDPEQVTIQDDGAVVPQWRLDGKSTQLDQIRIGQKPGRHLGTSPLEECLDSLAIVAAQEAYAEQYFLSNGQPHTVLETEQKLTPEETKALRDAYVKARGESGVAALSQGFTASFPSLDPESSQLTDSRDWGNTQVARLLGIPGPLLLTSGQSGSITYSNTEKLVSALAKQTILPLYLAPVEAWLTDQLPRGTSVRYNVGELVRADVKDKITMYQQLQTMGVVDTSVIATALHLDPDEMPLPDPAEQDEPANVEEEEDARATA